MSETAMINNVSIDIQTKRKITINGDENSFIELNTNDLGIISRFGSAIPELTKLSEEFMLIGEDADSEEGEDTEEAVLEKVARVANKFDEVNRKATELVNGIFDYDVCTPILKGSSVFTLTNGEFAFETIITSLLPLYGDSIQKETKKLETKMKKYTNKYLPQDHKRKK